MTIPANQSLKNFWRIMLGIKLPDDSRSSALPLGESPPELMTGELPVAHPHPLRNLVLLLLLATSGAYMAWALVTP